MLDEIRISHRYPPFTGVLLLSFNVFRSGLFYEENFAQKWDISRPIPYMFDSSIGEFPNEGLKQSTVAFKVYCIGLDVVCLVFKFYG